MGARQLKPSEVPNILKQLVAKQKNKCAICGKPFTSRDYPVLDHNHTTGFIRGALHNSCNGAEGRVKTKAHLGHKGVAAEDYLIGLGEYLKDNEKPKYMFIHPSHMTEEAKRIKRNAKARAARAAKRKLSK